MSRALLPPNRTALEAALADSLALTSDPARLATRWDAEQCPAAWLPWLAWSLSVEGWESATSIAQQRELIRTAIPTHRKKGTPSAIVDALAALGFSARIQDGRDLAPHAFAVDIDLHAQGLDQHALARLDAVINEYKNVRSYVNVLRIVLASHSSVCVSSAAYLGDILTVYPYTATELTVHGHTRVMSATHFIDTLSIYP